MSKEKRKMNPYQRITFRLEINAKTCTVIPDVLEYLSKAIREDRFFRDDMETIIACSPIEGGNYKWHVEMSRLKRCPICGAKPSIFCGDDDFWNVMCPNCDKHGALTAIVDKATKQDAEEAWNAQTVEDIEREFPILKEAREALEKEETK